MEEKQVYGLQILTFLIKQFDYQIVNIKNLKTHDYWLINLNRKYPLICITQDLYSQSNVKQGVFGQIYTAITTTFKEHSKCMIINTNSLSEKFELDGIIQIPVFDNQTLDPTLVNEFIGIEKIVKKVDNVNKEKRNLARSLKKMENISHPITNVIGIICLIVYFACSLLTNISHDSITSSIVLGSYYKINIVGAYEYWRLLTSGFIHIDFFHLLMNMMTLMFMGTVLEHQMKKSHYILTLLISIVVGNLFVLIGDSNIVGVGISGGLYGLLGVYTVYIYSSGAYKNQQILQSFVSMISINIVISLLPNISGLAHLGGYITGVVLGIYFSKSKVLKNIKKHVLVAFVAVVIGCMAWIPNVSRITPIYGGTDAMVIYTLRELHLDSYAEHLLNRFDAHLDNQGDSGYKAFINELVEDLKEEYNETK